MNEVTNNKAKGVQVKNSTGSIRASHINSGTSISLEDLRQPKSRGRVFRHPRLQLDSEPGFITPYGGLALACSVVSKLRLPQSIDKHLNLLKQHRPFSESDHVLAQTYNLFVGGGCIEDMANLQNSECALRMLGACRFPDPTTGGDFLRRFAESDLDALDAAIDEVQDRVWRQRFGQRKQPQAVIDIDSHIKEVYGKQKQGADFSHKGSWSYHPLAITFAKTQEVLRLVNRSGNAHSARGAVKQIQEVLDWLGKRFKQIILRGDSAFLSHEVTDTVHENGHHFALVMPGYPNLNELADQLPPESWTEFEPASKKQRKKRREGKPKRNRRQNLRQEKALHLKKRNLQLQEQWVAEIPYKMARSKHTYRLIIRKQRIFEHNRQSLLFETWRYRFALTNMEATSANEILDLTYQRCDQENVIEQLQSGIAGMRMPTGDLLANGAFLRCARIAQNLKSWICQLALREETIRWKWKRFRLSFVYVAATVIKHARQTWVKIAQSHRFCGEMLLAHSRLQV